ncbi:MAG: hypothetical protein HY847_09320 [Betaproteobacteria bacterium]|nr:hypothetical protein [Betaproteobacteria bacterium]
MKLPDCGSGVIALAGNPETTPTSRWLDLISRRSVRARFDGTHRLVLAAVCLAAPGL